MNDHSSVSTFTQGVVCQDHTHTSRLPVYYTSKPGHGESREEEENHQEQQFRGGHALLDKDKLESVIVVRMRDRRRRQRRSDGLFIFAAGLRQVETWKGLCTYPTLASVILKEDNKHLRHHASTKSPKMSIYNADSDLKSWFPNLHLLQVVFFYSRSDIFPWGN